MRLLQDPRSPAVTRCAHGRSQDVPQDAVRVPAQIEKHTVPGRGGAGETDGEGSQGDASEARIVVDSEEAPRLKVWIVHQVGAVLDHPGRDSLRL